MLVKWMQQLLLKSNMLQSPFILGEGREGFPERNRAGEPLGGGEGSDKNGSGISLTPKINKTPSAFPSRGWGRAPRQEGG